MSLDERIDPVDLLQMYSAPDGWDSTVELTGPDADADAVSLLQRVVGGQVAATGPRRRHLRLVTGVIIAASLGGAAVAAATILSRSPDEPESVSCWSESVAPPEAQVGLGWDGIDDPISICSDEWRGGRLGADGPPQPLQACVNEDGVAAVVPGDETTCEHLGLESFAPIDPATSNGQMLLDVSILERRLVATYNVGPCRSPELVVPEVETLLNDLGFVGWDVTIAGIFSADEPCASIAVEPETTTVVVVPG